MIVCLNLPLGVTLRFFYPLGVNPKNPFSVTLIVYTIPSRNPL